MAIRLSIRHGMYLLMLGALIIPSHVLAQQSERSVEELIAALTDGNLDERRDAVYDLAKMGSEASPAVSALTGALKDRDDQIWAQAITALARLGPAAEPAIPELIRYLDTRDNQRRYRVAFALGSIGPAALPSLRESLHAENELSRAAAAEAIGWMEAEGTAAIEDLVATLNDSEDEVQDAAVTALIRIGHGAESALTAALADENARVRWGAATVLVGIRPELPETSLQLQQRLGDETDGRVRAAVMTALGNSAASRDKVVDAIIVALQDPELEVRQSAALALRRLGAAAARAIPVLTELLQNEDSDTRESAARALATLGPAAKSAVGPLIECLHQLRLSDDIVFDAMGRIGPVAVPELLQAAERKSISVEQLSLRLAGMGADVTDPLILAMDDEHKDVRIGAVRALGQIEPPPTQAVSALTARLADDAAGVRAAAAESLGHLGPAAATAVSKLVEMAADPAPQVRAESVVALMSITSNDEDNHEAIRNVVSGTLSDGEATVRIRIADALTDHPALAKSQLDPLANMLTDSVADVRAAAAGALGSLGEEALNVVDPLGRLLDDSDASVRNAAVISLGQIGAGAAKYRGGVSNLLENADPPLTITGLEALAGMGQAAEDQADMIAGLLAHEQAGVRTAAVKSLIKISPEPADVVPRLVGVLEDSEWEVRKTAALELGQIGKPAKAAVPVLFQRLKFEEDRDFAGDALRQIDDVELEALPFLVDALKMDDDRTRFYAVFFIGKLGTDARDALPALQKLKEDGSSRFQRYLERTIEQIEKGSDDEE